MVIGNKIKNSPEDMAIRTNAARMATGQVTDYQKGLRAEVVYIDALSEVACT